MLIAAAVGGVAALVGVAGHLSGEERAILRDAQRIPDAAARDLRDGERVKLTGCIVRLGAALEAPLSTRPCVAYRVRLHASQDATGAYAQEERRSDFLVRDASGELAWVLARGGRLIVAPDVEMRVGRTRAADVRAAAFLERHGHPLTATRRAKMRFVLEEGVLAAGDVVTIVASVRRELDPTDLLVRSLRQPPIRLVFEAGDGEPLHLIAAARRPA